MQRKLYKELWSLRFRKMLMLEEQSMTDYQSLLEECQNGCDDSSVAPHLRQLIRDEKKHVSLVQELINITNRQSN